MASRAGVRAVRRLPADPLLSPSPWHPERERRPCLCGNLPFEANSWRGGGTVGGVGRAPACEMSRAPTISPMSADRLGAIACILSSRYACSCRRYSASEMTRRANVSMLIMSIGLMSWPMDVLAASRISRARSSSPVTSVSSARRARARAQAALGAPDTLRASPATGRKACAVVPLRPLCCVKNGSPYG